MAEERAITPAAQLPPEGTILTVVAHPDDADFGMAGTVAAATAAGRRVVHCVVTDGDAGGFDATISRPRMAEIRREEQRAAARAIGVHEVIFLGYPDGRVVPSLELRRDISRVIRQVRPICVLTQSSLRHPGRFFVNHPDHLAVGEATLCAVYPDARNPFAHPELLEEGHQEHTVEEVWIVGGSPIDTWVDITDTFASKLAALACHVSQVSHHEQSAFHQRLRERSEEQAGAAGWPPGRLAEGFQRILTR